MPVLVCQLPFVTFSLSSATVLSYATLSDALNQPTSQQLAYRS